MGGYSLPLKNRDMFRDLKKGIVSISIGGR